MAVWTTSPETARSNHTWIPRAALATLHPYLHGEVCEAINKKPDKREALREGEGRAGLEHGGVLQLLPQNISRRDCVTTMSRLPCRLFSTARLLACSPHPVIHTSVHRAAGALRQLATAATQVLSGSAVSAADARRPGGRPVPKLTEV